MKNYLAIETSTEHVLVQMRVADRLVHRREAANRNKLNRLPELILELQHELGCELKAIDGVAYGMGPGSFTGVRIGAAYAQSIAYGVDCPILGISSLQALAQTAFDTHAQDEVHVLLDARMREFYYGQYRADEQGIMRLVSEHEQLLTEAGVKLLELDPSHRVSAEDLRIDHKSLDKLIQALAVKGFAVSPLQIQMNYIRNKVTQG